MADQHKGFTEGLSSPADQWFDVTPSDSVALDPIPRGLFIGSATGSRTLALEDKEGTIATFKVMAGQLLPVRPRKVLVNGTSGVSDIVAIL